MEYQTNVAKEQKKELNQKFQKKKRILNMLLWFYVGAFILFFILMQFNKEIALVADIFFLLMMIHGLIAHRSMKCPYCGNNNSSVQQGKSCDQCFAILAEVK